MIVWKLNKVTLHLALNPCVCLKDNKQVAAASHSANAKTKTETCEDFIYWNIFFSSKKLQNVHALQTLPKEAFGIFNHEILYYNFFEV